MPSSSAPRYAVVIPTRNRAETCVEAVETVLACRRADVEIILPDASDDPTALPARLAAAGLSDAVAILPPAGAPLAMRENWERGLDAARAPWIIYLGDDDGVLPNAFEMLDALTDNAATPVVAWEPVDYRWPCYPGASAGQMTLPLDAASVGFVEAEARLLRHFGWRTRKKWPEVGPSIYHGAVHRDLVERVRRRHGRYFLGFIVDYASAIANLAEIRTYLRYSGALTVLGASGKSNSAGLSASGEAAKRYDEVIAENPGLAPLHPGLGRSRLHAPLVASGYREVFAALGAAFELAPERMLASCVDELGSIVDPEAFERERGALLDFAAAAGVSDAPARAAAYRPPVCGVGPDAEKRRFAVNTRALGWRGVADASAGARAFLFGAAIKPQDAAQALACAIDALGASTAP